MPIKIPKIGELNSIEQSQNPLSLDSDVSAVDIISKNNKDATSPRVLSKMIGNYRGIVFKGTSDVPEIKDNSNWFMRLLKSPMKKHRIYIPEIHSHLPLPDNFADTKQTIACMYPEFISESENVDKAEPGTIVWCGFLNKENFLEPVYRGVVANSPIIPAEQLTLQSLLVPQKTLLAGSPGTDLKQVASPSVSLSKDNTTNKNLNEPDCTEPLNFSNCPQQSIIAGEYDIYENGKISGRAKMVVWTNKDGKSVLIRDMIQNSLIAMNVAMKNDINEDLQINSGFRSYEQQACMYEIYKKCLKKWEDNGRKGAPPSSVSDPNKSGKYSHLTGMAIDLNTGVARKEITGLSILQIKENILKRDYTARWRWLVTNSEKYGFVWSGKNFNEPWHFEFNEDLAMRNNLI